MAVARRGEAGGRRGGGCSGTGSVQAVGEVGFSCLHEGAWWSGEVLQPGSRRLLRGRRGLGTALRRWRGGSCGRRLGRSSRQRRRASGRLELGLGVAGARARWGSGHKEELWHQGCASSASGAGCIGPALWWLRCAAWRACVQVSVSELAAGARRGAQPRAGHHGDRR